MTPAIAVSLYVLSIEILEQWTLHSGAIGPKRQREQQEIPMPTMTNTRRKKIQADQRKALNIQKRAAKVAKKERNKG